MDNQQSRLNRKKKRSRKRRFIILTPILLVIILASSYLLHINSTAESAANEAHDDDTVYEENKSDLREEKPDPKYDNVSILIMGIDSGEGDKRSLDEEARTDALMLATLNKKDNSVKLLSIPRDSDVYVPEIDGMTKINHAHARGGPKATKDTVENLLGIPIDYYVRINFEAFMQVVDTLGGITVDVPYEFSEQDSKDQPNAIHLLAGEQELDGEEALALARTRKLDSDIERGKRQQDIIKAILKKSLSVKSILKYDDMIEAVGRNMKTNMKYKEMKSFFSYVIKGTSLDIESLTLDGEDSWTDRGYFWELDDRSLAKNTNILEEHLGLPVTDFGYDFSEDEDNETDNNPEEFEE